MKYYHFLCRQPNEGAWYMYVEFLTCVSALPTFESYSYYSAGTSGTFDNQRLHALRGSSTIIWDSDWSYAGDYPS